MTSNLYKDSKRRYQTLTLRWLIGRLGLIFATCRRALTNTICALLKLIKHRYGGFTSAVISKDLYRRVTIMQYDDPRRVEKVTPSSRLYLVGSVSSCHINLPLVTPYSRRNKNEEMMLEGGKASCAASIVAALVFLISTRTSFVIVYPLVFARSKYLASHLPVYATAPSATYFPSDIAGVVLCTLGWLARIQMVPDLRVSKYQRELGKAEKTKLSLDKAIYNFSRNFANTLEPQLHSTRNIL